MEQPCNNEGRCGAVVRMRDGVERRAQSTGDAGSVAAVAANNRGASRPHWLVPRDMPVGSPREEKHEMEARDHNQNDHRRKSIIASEEAHDNLNRETQT